MKGTILFIFCLAFVIQIDNILAGGGGAGEDDGSNSGKQNQLQKSTSLSRSGSKNAIQVQDQEKDARKLTDTARNTVNKVIGHVEFMLRDPRSSQALVKVAHNGEKLMVSQIGQDNILQVLDLVRFMLVDKNGSQILGIVCDKLSAFLTKSKGKLVIQATLRSVERVFSYTKVTDAVKGFLSGFNRYLATLTAQQVIEGLYRIKRMSNWVIKPKEEDPNKPKTKRQNSRKPETNDEENLQARNLYDKNMEQQFQARDVVISNEIANFSA